MSRDPEDEDYAEALADPMAALCGGMWATVAVTVAGDARRAADGLSEAEVAAMAAASVAVLSALAGRLSKSLASMWHAATSRVARDNRAWAASQAREVGRALDYDPAALVALYRRRQDAALMMPLDDLLMLDSTGRWRPVGQAYSDLVRDSMRRHPQDPQAVMSEVTRALRASGGLRIKRPGLTERGRERPSLDIESRVRLDVVSNVNALTQDIRDETGRQLGLTSVRVSAHACPAPDHAPYQGRVYTREEFDRIQGSLDRPIGAYNCRHVTFPCADGASPSYSESELRGLERSGSRPVTLAVGGREATRTRYEWTQWMRRQETAARTDRVNAMLMEAAGESGAADRASAARRASMVRAVGGAIGMPADPRRMRVHRLS